ncbi:MAG: UMP kinase [Candidatus Thermoplasmatota archaeon]|nr:UMP kinase [Candidatus Thermoplasmatota archaeon]MCL5983168.1 UMP kinase [Candidatus Thermoplasmatota archaeon]
MPSAPAKGAIVLSVGGSVFRTGEDDVAYLGRLADLMRRVGRRHPLAVTVGGGRTAREYIGIGRELGLTEIELDEIGIDVTRLHARLLAGRIGSPTPSHPPTTLAEAVLELRHGSPVVLGGTEPGHTTDGVAALLAVRLRAERFVNATNVDALYDRDPKLDPKAAPIRRIPWPKFRALVHERSGAQAGQQFLFDRLGADQLARIRIPTAIVFGRDLPNLEKALLGRPFLGTEIY